jgi:hypothetical protein
MTFNDMPSLPIQPDEDDFLQDEYITNEQIYALLTQLVASHNEIVDKVNNLITTVEPHIAEIAPTIDAIANHPMLKMFIGKKGK